MALQSDARQRGHSLARTQTIKADHSTALVTIARRCCRCTSGERACVGDRRVMRRAVKCVL